MVFERIWGTKGVGEKGTNGMSGLDEFGTFLLELIKEDKEFRQWFLREFGEKEVLEEAQGQAH